ncbi:hypothetical protein OIU85_007031 [Salix viminalis]|uniref:mitogen-activated protein kinase kinase kinase n=1 Tax=Salix viminalis TaxID=40686 RepID=A0A9Q0P814_SALVM|nr:hypothetical protein OIU85_007031 [Salix viminalis]
MKKVVRQVMRAAMTSLLTASLPISSFSYMVLSPMPSSSKQAAFAASCSFSDHVEAFAASCSFSDHVEAFARYVMRVVQTLTPVVQAAAPLAGYCAWLISDKISTKYCSTNTENSKVPFNSECGEYKDEVKSITIMSNPWQITRRGRDITEWERGEVIGTGSFGSVYRCSNEDGSFFAAKGVSLNEHRHLCHLENEISILKRLDHPNIIQYYGTERGGEMLYIFLELVSHGTLKQAYENFCFKQPQVSNYTRQLLQGLRYLHSCKVVHGDVKCANILITEPGRIKLADFGLSKSMEDHSESSELGLGSPLWMAPEVDKLNRVGYGFASDIWSLGCTVTELSTRKYPQYNARDRVSLARAIRSGEGPVVPANLSDTLKDFINQCLQPDPNQRPTADYLLAHPFVKE